MLKEAQKLTLYRLFATTALLLISKYMQVTMLRKAYLTLEQRASLVFDVPDPEGQDAQPAATMFFEAQPTVRIFYYSVRASHGRVGG